MAYATIDDVRALAPQFVMSTTTRPSEAQVIAYLDDVTLEVEAALSNLGYVVPVASGPRALSMLRIIVAHGALSRAMYARSFGMGNPKDMGTDEVEAKYQRWLKDLASPSNRLVELNDAPRTSRQPLKDAADRVLGIADLDDANYQSGPRATRDQVF
jgi:hypothetical protein